MSPNFEVDDRSVVEFQLGNKQLLLLFLGLIVICAIFFFIGLRVGEDTARGKAAIVLSDDEGNEAADSAESEPNEQAAKVKAAAADEPVTRPAKQKEKEPPSSRSAKQNKSEEPKQADKTAKESSSPPVSGPARVVAAPPAGWYIQVASLTSESGAQNKAKTIPGGHSTLIQKTDAPGKLYYRVLIGPHTSKDNALKVKQTLGRNFSDAILKRF